MRCDESSRCENFVQRHVGLHQVGFRAREHANIDTAYRFLQSIGAKIVHPPEDGPWAPGYYSVLCERIPTESGSISIAYPARGLLA
jgi:hypothetical protein